jgi:hypothetical protein
MDVRAYPLQNFVIIVIPQSLGELTYLKQTTIDQDLWLVIAYQEMSMNNWTDLYLLNPTQVLGKIITKGFSYVIVAHE